MATPSGIHQIGQAKDGVPVFQDSGGSYYTQNADGSYTQQNLSPSDVSDPTGQSSNPYGPDGSTAPWLPGEDHPQSDYYPGWHWDASMARYMKDAPAATTPPPDTGGGGAPSDGGGYVPPPTPPTTTGGGGSPYQPTPPTTSAGAIAANPPQFNAPSYTPPPAFTYADFVAPDANAVYSDPSYQLRFGMGQQAIENSKAASGVIGTGGSIKDFINYGQNFASQEYNNIYNRDLSTYAANRANALGTYNTNYGTQYVDPFQFAFQNAQATLQPQELGYTTQVNQAQQQADQAALYGFNNKVFDANNALATSQNSFDQWYRKFLLEMQASQ